MCIAPRVRPSLHPIPPAVNNVLCSVFLRGCLLCVTSDRVVITVGSALQGQFYVLFNFSSMNK